MHKFVKSSVLKMSYNYSNIKNVIRFLSDNIYVIIFIFDINKIKYSRNVEKICRVTSEMIRDSCHKYYYFDE